CTRAWMVGTVATSERSDIW
nr:immunoglobulin heavy chain junction region [Macaca mulatta]